MPIFSIANPQSYQNAATQLGISGKNPFNSLLRMAGLVYGGQALDDLNFAASMAPDRRNWIRYALGMASPANSQARLDAFANQARAHARETGALLRQRAPMKGDAASESEARGLALDAERAIQSAIRTEGLPETQMARIGQSLQLFDAASAPDSLSLLASLAGQLDSIVGRQQARRRSGNGLTGLLQSAAQLYGIGAFGGGRFTPGINGG